MQHQPLKGEERKKLLEALYNKYARSPNFSQRFIYWRKKYAWQLVVGGTKFIKRIFDILLSLFFLVLFSPLMLIIAILIKLNDGGPVLYATPRVGKWGKEFPFPKFRTMEIGANERKQDLIEKNIHGEDIKFKILKDPRVTKIGKILRKTSMDELPQLWTVLKGDMSLVGPRPPLPEEVAKYSLEQRKRLDVTPGITGLWQVSGRSDIPFNKQVELDIKYIESQSIWLDILILLKTIPAVLFGRGAY